jgi:hypothetical protein
MHQENKHKYFIVFYLLLIFSGCNSNIAIISPKELIFKIPIKSVINFSGRPDSINTIYSFTDVNNYWLIGYDNHLVVLNKNTKSVLKHYQYEISDHKDLFDGQDSIVGFRCSAQVINSDKSKLLITTANGLLAQLDLKTLDLDWMLKIKDRFECVSYSKDGKSIAIGTGYNHLDKSKDYYSSIFLIDSKSGEFINHFNEYASIKKIIFINNDKQLLTAYDWHYTDIFLWDISNTNQSVKQFRQKHFIHDIEMLNENTFLSVTDGGLFKWSIDKPDIKEELLPNTTYDNTLILNKASSGILFLSFSNLYYINTDGTVSDSTKINIPAIDIYNSEKPTEVIVMNLTYDRNSIYVYDIIKKEIIQKIEKTELNKFLIRQYNKK